MEEGGHEAQQQGLLRFFEEKKGPWIFRAEFGRYDAKAAKGTLGNLVGHSSDPSESWLFGSCRQF